MNRALAIAAVLATAAMLSGCSQVGGSPPQPTNTAHVGASASEPQSQAMTDGRVTQDEYEAGFRRYSECVAKGGYQVSRGATENNEIQYTVPLAAKKVSDACYQKEFANIDTAWQNANIDTSYTAQVLRDCLVSHKITPKQHFLDMEAQVEKARISFEECQSEEDHKSTPAP